MSTKIFDRDAISKAEQRAAIATAQLQVAESYRFFMGALAGGFAWKVLEWNGWVSFAIGCIAFFFADYSYSKEYDKAQSELERLWKEPSDDTPSP
jgi:hypothetical protein